MSVDLRIYEVSLRDGLQNEPAIIETALKLQHLQHLLDAGFKDIEVTSFVRPRWIPALADAAELCAHLPDLSKAHPDVRFWALVPNARGLERALDSDVKHIATFVSASESHNKKNVNRTVRESMAALDVVVGDARREGMAVRGYISCVFGCPFEGWVDPQRTLDLALRLLDAGASELALGDTIGSGNPLQVTEILQTLTDGGVPLDKIGVHFHDTQGTALTNAFAAWQFGVRTFDGSLGGLGGCPYAPGAAGNAATEDLVNMFELMGLSTGIDLDLAADGARWMGGVIGKSLPGRFHKYRVAERGRRSESPPMANPAKAAKGAVVGE